MTLTDWNAISQLIYNFAASIAALGALGAGIVAVITFKRNVRLERARWSLSLYEKFFEKEQLQKIRETLDCESDVEQVIELVLKEPAEFTNYLNFFEFIAFLKDNEQLQDQEVEDLFGYYLRCLKKHERVRRYIREQDYQKLDNLLEKWK